MKTMREIENEILQDLDDLDDGMMQVTYLVECGKFLECMPEPFKTDENLIRECQVKTWLYCNIIQNKVVFYADSEALLVKGALALLQEIYAGRSRRELQEYDCRLLEEQKFMTHYTANQQKGLRAILEKLKYQ